MNWLILLALVLFMAFLEGINAGVEERIQSEPKVIPYIERLHYESRPLSAVQRLHVLENELLDPHRSPVFDAELQDEIARLRRSIERVVIATCGCD